MSEMFNGLLTGFSLVLSPMFENSLRQSLLMSEGSFAIFFTRPISCILMVAGIVLFSIAALPWLKRKPFKESEAAPSR